MCWDILIRNPCDSIDLKTDKPFVSYLWMTWFMISRIMGNNRTCIIQNTLFPFVLFQINFSYTSWILSVKLTWNHKSSKPNLNPINRLSKWLLKNESACRPFQERCDFVRAHTWALPVFYQDMCLFLCYCYTDCCHWLSNQCYINKYFDYESYWFFREIKKGPLLRPIYRHLKGIFVVENKPV